MNTSLSARVKETTTTTGTGTISLGGAVSGYRNFASGFVNGSYVYYTIIDGTAWEQGIGLFTAGGPSTIARTAVLQSSNSDAALNLGAGSKVIFCDSTRDAFYEPGTEIFMSLLGRAAPSTFLLVSGTAYFVYIGRSSRPFFYSFLEVQVTTGGTGAQTAEVGLFHSPYAPDKAGQTLTKIVATGTVDALTSAGMKRNTSNFSGLLIPGGKHLWAGIRTALASTQPTCTGLAGDHAQGHVLTTTGGGALTGLTTVAGSIVAVGTVTIAPDIRLTSS